MIDTINKLKELLHNSIDSSPEQVSRFFKTDIGDYAEHEQFIGITVPTLRKIAKQFISIPLLDLTYLIQSPFNEERLLTLIILTQRYQTGSDEQKEEIYRFYLQNMRYINNWNLIDSSAHLILGAHLFEKDNLILKKLAHSKNMWDCRIAIVATWYFIRKSQLDSTFDIAHILLNDDHDLIHKSVGWMLREAGKKMNTV